jgi:ArsR family transcriptional regulator
MMAKSLKQFVKTMKALSDENRVIVLKLLLAKKELCVCELQSLLKLSQPTVSRHLKISEEAGFLESRRERQWIIYRLNRLNSYKFF